MPQDGSTPQDAAMPNISHVTNISLDTVTFYDGSTEVCDFIDGVECNAVLGNWSDAQKLVIAKLKLKDAAMILLQSETRFSDAGATWEQFKTALLKKFKKEEITCTCSSDSGVFLMSPKGK